MKTFIFVASALSILFMVLLASSASSQQSARPLQLQPLPQQPLSQQPALPQQPPQPQQESCGQMSGQSINVSGIIDYITTNAFLEVTYYLRSEGRPCIYDAFTIVDPRGPARCREGLKITASGILQMTATGARITTSNYSCQ